MPAKNYVYTAKQCLTGLAKNGVASAQLTAYPHRYQEHKYVRLVPVDTCLQIRYTKSICRDCYKLMGCHRAARMLGQTSHKTVNKSAIIIEETSSVSLLDLRLSCYQCYCFAILRSSICFLSITGGRQNTVPRASPLEMRYTMHDTCFPLSCGNRYKNRNEKCTKNEANSPLCPISMNAICGTVHPHFDSVDVEYRHGVTKL
jgi:hypothetical protein